MLALTAGCAADLDHGTSGAALGSAVAGDGCGCVCRRCKLLGGVSIGVAACTCLSVGAVQHCAACACELQAPGCWVLALRCCLPEQDVSDLQPAWPCAHHAAAAQAESRLHPCRKQAAVLAWPGAAPAGCSALEEQPAYSLGPCVAGQAGSRLHQAALHLRAAALIAALPAAARLAADWQVAALKPLRAALAALTLCLAAKRLSAAQTTQYVEAAALQDAHKTAEETAPAVLLGAG